MHDVIRIGEDVYEKLDGDVVVLNQKAYRRVPAEEKDSLFDIDGKPRSRNRSVVVIDRGWIFAGDVTERNDRLILTRVVWVFRWEEIGMDGVLQDPKSPKVTLRPLENMINVPRDSEIFRFEVEDNWGL